MTDEAKKETLRPVSSYENKQVDGGALACKRVHTSNVEEVKALRQRQQRYFESLPNDRKEALQEIAIIGAQLDDKKDAPRAALTVIRELAMLGAIEEWHEMQSAIYWLAEQALEGVSTFEEAIERTHDIASRFHDGHEPYEA